MATTSTANSFSGAPAAFTGTAEDVLRYQSITLAVSSNRHHEITAEWSADKTNWDHSTTYLHAAGSETHLNLTKKNQYYRLRLAPVDLPTIGAIGAQAAYMLATTTFAGSEHSAPESVQLMGGLGLPGELYAVRPLFGDSEEISRAMQPGPRGIVDVVVSATGDPAGVVYMVLQLFDFIGNNGETYVDANTGRIPIQGGTGPTSQHHHQFTVTRKFRFKMINENAGNGFGIILTASTV